MLFRGEKLRMGKICTFAGHSKAYGDENAISNKLYELARDLVVKEGVDTFWIGNYGRFDAIASREIKELKKEFPYIRSELVLPYLNVRICDGNFSRENYDSVFIADIPENTPMRYRISKCNQFMIKNANFLISFIKFCWGGAQKTVEYAQSQKHIKIFNINDYL